MRPAPPARIHIPVSALAQDQPGHFAPLLLGERRPEFVDRALSFAVPALLAALVVTGLVVERHDIVIDARLAEVDRLPQQRSWAYCAGHFQHL